MITLRLSTVHDVPLAMTFIREAKAHQQEQGFVQWDEDYPTTTLLMGDVELSRGYVVESDGEPIGYVCLDFGGEPAYTVIKGAWKTNDPYMVMHRLAFGNAARGKGASREVFRLAKEMCLARGVHAMRADTHPENVKMQHIFLREGFIYCGDIYLQGGDKRAYEWDF